MLQHEINTPVQFISDSVHFVLEKRAMVKAELGERLALRAAPGPDPS